VALSGKVPGSAVATTSRVKPSGPHQPSLASAAHQVSVCPSRKVRVTGRQSPGSGGPSRASARAASTGGMRVRAVGQVPQRGLSAITNGSPASASSPWNPSWSPWALSAATARNANPASRAKTARSAPIASLVRNPGSLCAGPAELAVPASRGFYSLAAIVVEGGGVVAGAGISIGSPLGDMVG
jgi:hypothetical protein